MYAINEPPPWRAPPPSCANSAAGHIRRRTPAHGGDPPHTRRQLQTIGTAAHGQRNRKAGRLSHRKLLNHMHRRQNIALLRFMNIGFPLAGRAISAAKHARGYNCTAAPPTKSLSGARRASQLHRQTARYNSLYGHTLHSSRAAGISSTSSSSLVEDILNIRFKHINEL